MLLAASGRPGSLPRAWKSRHAPSVSARSGSLFRRAERQTRSPEREPERALDTYRLSESSGDAAGPKAGQHPRPDDSHGACSLTVPEYCSRLISARFVAVGRSIVVKAALRRSQRYVRRATFAGFPANELRRCLTSGRSRVFPRARVCLSKLGERPWIGRL